MDHDKPGEIWPQITRAALELFGEQGVSATKIRDITNRAKVSIGGFYGHFSSKEDLMKQVFNHYHTMFSQSIEKILATSFTPAEKIEWVVEVFAYFIKVDRIAAKFVLSSFSSKYWKKIAPEGGLEAVRLLAEIIEDGVEQEEFESPAPYDAAMFFLGGLTNYFLAWLSGDLLTPDTKQLTRYILNALNYKEKK